MAEHGFTPGPWHAQACNSWNVWSKDCKVADPIRCAQAEPYRVPSDAERIANARLIAAAPELLAALEWLHLGKGQPVDVAAIIAKANGSAL